MSRMKKTISAIALVAAVVSGADPVGSADDTSFDSVAVSFEQQLRSALIELDTLREQAARETLPLSKGLTALEHKLVEVRNQYQQTSRMLDGRTLDLSNLNAEIKARKEEKNYLSNLLGEYVRSFESNLHIAEIQRYEEVLELARLAPESNSLSELHVFAAQTDLVNASLEGLGEALGGSIFEGTAVDPDGTVKKGHFAMVGPNVLFSSADGAIVGTAEQRIGSLEPAAITFRDPVDWEAARQMVAEGTGRFPLDPTLGSAHKVEATKEGLVEHMKKGGPVMIPILVLAGAALLVAVFKWLGMLFLRKPSGKKIRSLLAAVSEHNRPLAGEVVTKIKGPVGRMLQAGVEHIKEPGELIEEVMYEQVLTTRLKLQRLLPFIAISAASAPLLGLLGTVTGIINTFKLITVFGSGDVKTLSGGISEALITTEFGLIVAIPSLLLHAFLSRKARGFVDQMEKAAVAFVNQVRKSPFKHTRDIEDEG